MELHLFLTSAPDDGEWSISHTGRFTPAKNPGTHCIGGSVGPKVSTYFLEKSKIYVTYQEANPRPSSP